MPGRVLIVDDIATNRLILRARLAENQPVPEGQAWLQFPPQRTKLFADERLVGS